MNVEFWKREPPSTVRHAPALGGVSARMAPHSTMLTGTCTTEWTDIKRVLERMNWIVTSQLLRRYHQSRQILQSKNRLSLAVATGHRTAWGKIAASILMSLNSLDLITLATYSQGLSQADATVAWLTNHVIRAVTEAHGCLGCLDPVQMVHIRALPHLSPRYPSCFLECLSKTIRSWKDRTLMPLSTVDRVL